MTFSSFRKISSTKFQRSKSRTQSKQSDAKKSQRASHEIQKLNTSFRIKSIGRKNGRLTFPELDIWRQGSFQGNWRKWQKKRRSFRWMIAGLECWLRRWKRGKRYQLESILNWNNFDFGLKYYSARAFLKTALPWPFGPVWPSPGLF